MITDTEIPQFWCIASHLSTTRGWFTCMRHVTLVGLSDASMIRDMKEVTMMFFELIYSWAPRYVLWKEATYRYQKRRIMKDWMRKEATVLQTHHKQSDQDGASILVSCPKTWGKNEIKWIKGMLAWISDTERDLQCSRQLGCLLCLDYQLKHTTYDWFQQTAVVFWGLWCELQQHRVCIR